MASLRLCNSQDNACPCVYIVYILFFRFVPVLGGIFNSFSTLAGMICPIVAGVLTPNVSLTSLPQTINKLVNQINGLFSHVYLFKNQQDA